MSHKYLYIIMTVLCLFSATLFGELEKKSNSTLQLPIAPLDASYSFEPAWQELNESISEPVLMVSYPDTEGLVIVTKGGKIWHLNNTSERQLSLFLDLTDLVLNLGEAGLQSIVFHPDFAENGYCYVFYNSFWPESDELVDVVSRFKVTSGPPPEVDRGSEDIMIYQHNRFVSHIGGSMLFGNDGYLYISFGDEGRDYDFFENSQKIDDKFFSSIIRIDVDRRSGNFEPNPSSHIISGKYKVPNDNPFIGFTSFGGETVDTNKLRTEIWALGFRNPWRMHFDTEDEVLYASDVGQASWEEINIIEKGNNYGWIYYEGNEQTSENEPPVGFTYTEPLFAYGRDLGGANVCGIVYHGDRYPELDGSLLFGDFNTGKIFRLQHSGEGSDVSEIGRVASPVAFWQDDSSDEIIIMSLFGENLFHRMIINNLTDVATEEDLPLMLSDVGAFSNLETLSTFEGIHSYSVKLPFWSDYADKQRWFGLTQGGVFEFDSIESFGTPAGAFWIKHFDLEIERGNPNSSRRIETRFIVRYEEGIYGLTYRWNEAQTDAELVPQEGASTAFSVIDKDGKRVEQIWAFPSRSDCLTCHNDTAGQTLAFNAAQLNLNHPIEGVNQLALLQRSGYLSHREEINPSEESMLYEPDDSLRTLEERVRSYLHANCAACHRPAGAGLGFWDARVAFPTRITGIVNGSVQHDFGDPGMRIIKMGDEERSSIFRRIASNTERRMPPLGSHELDEEAIELMRSWIRENAYEDFFVNALDYGAANKYDSSYGWFFDFQLPWVFNYALGWSWVSGSSDSIWSYTINYGWVWTGDGTFPYVYADDLNRWLYFAQELDTFGFYFDPVEDRWLYQEP